MGAGVSSSPSPPQQKEERQFVFDETSKSLRTNDADVGLSIPEDVLSKVTKIEALQVDNLLTGSDIRTIVHCTPNLTQLELAGFNHNDRVIPEDVLFAHLRDMHELTQLTLEGAMLRDTSFLPDPRELHSYNGEMFGNITKLTLNHCFSKPGGDFCVHCPALFSGMRGCKLEKIFMTSCYLSPDTFESFCAVARTIKQFDIRVDGSVTDTLLITLLVALGGNTRLESARVHGVDKTKLARLIESFEDPVKKYRLKNAFEKVDKDMLRAGSDPLSLSVISTRIADLLRSHELHIPVPIPETEECVICREPVNDTNMAPVFTCGHHKHCCVTCWDTWSRRSRTCPLCRDSNPEIISSIDNQRPRICPLNRLDTPFASNPLENGRVVPEYIVFYFYPDITVSDSYVWWANIRGYYRSFNADFPRLPGETADEHLTRFRRFLDQQ